MSYEQEQDTATEALHEPENVDTASEALPPEDTQEAPESAPEGQPGTETETAPDQADLEERARRMGWRPESEYRGPPEGYVGPDEFIQRAEQEMPVMRATLRKYDQRLAEQEKAMKVLAQHQDQIAKQEYERALSDLKAQSKAAAADGDVEAVADLVDRATQLKKQNEPEPQQQQQQQNPTHPDTLAWGKENPWFEQDRYLANHAMTINDKLMADHPYMPLRDRLDEITREIRKRFPEKFGIRPKPTNRSPAVEGTRPAAPSKTDKSYASLPPEAKAYCNKFVKEGLMTQEEYVKQYYEQ